MLLIRKCLNEDITAAGKFYDRVVEYLDAHINYPKWQYKIYPNEDYVRLNLMNDIIKPKQLNT